jgi:hypothetical protein
MGEIIARKMLSWLKLIIKLLLLRLVGCLYRVSLSLETPNYCLCIHSNSAGFSFVNTGQTGSFKTCQTAFRTEFGERRAPSKCCVQKLVKKLEARGSRSNACQLLSLGGPLKGKVYQNAPRTVEQHTDAIRQEIQAVNFDTLGKSIPEFGETHSSVLGCERRSVWASTMSRSCFASFPVCVHKLSSHYPNNIAFYRQ